MTRRLTPTRVLVAACAGLVFAAVVLTGGAIAAREAKVPLTEKVILFAADGMRPDLVDKYAAAGRHADDGRPHEGRSQGEERSASGLSAQHRSGLGDARHGNVAGHPRLDEQHLLRPGPEFVTGSTSFAAPGILQADTIAQAAERAGKSVVSMEWVAARSYTPALQGPVVDFRTFFSARGVLVNYDLPGQPAGANAFGVSYQRTGAADNQTPLYDVPAVNRRSAGRRGRLDERAGDAGDAEANAVPVAQHVLREQCDPPVRPVHLRHRRQRRGVRPRARRSVDCCQERHRRGRESRTGRVGGREGHAEWGLRRKDRRFLRQGDRDRS